MERGSCRSAVALVLLGWTTLLMALVNGIQPLEISLLFQVCFLARRGDWVKLLLGHVSKEQIRKI